MNTTDVPPKSPKEMAINRSSLWKRMGRRTRKSQSSMNVDTATEALEEPPIEDDNGDGRSLLTKRAQRKANKGSFIRKLKNSFQKTKSMSEQREDSEVFHESNLQPFDPSNNLHSPAYTAEDSLLSIESDLEDEKKESNEWKEVRLDRLKQEHIYRKQQMKERDGFCRRVDTYDGQVIVVDHTPTYEIGNYLGGGVAGVVYEGHRLRPMEEYPVRTGVRTSNPQDNAATQVDEDDGFFCGDHACGVDETEEPEVAQLEGKDNGISGAQETSNPLLTAGEEDMAIEATMSYDEAGGVMLDGIDAPSRSKHYTKAAAVPMRSRVNSKKSLQHGLPDESVAIKILNPVGYRILQADGLKDCVVVKKGAPMDSDVVKGLKPMEEKHVWWLVNPNSRNLRTLQRYNGKDEKSSAPKGLQIDRGSSKKGLRLSLIAAYIDPRSGSLRELTLTRCIEIWGHVPFNATDSEFEDMMTAIERVNAGHPPPAFPAFDDVPGRVGTDKSDPTDSCSEHEGDMLPITFGKARTGLIRAAFSQRVTIHCKSLNAYIAIPAVPSKYLRWLRQRRAATKEIRNMMLIGRHKNVLHLFEVLEYIQDSKSTMFLVLELVKGGELFDLISSSASKGSRNAGDTEQAELMMRKFFFELSSGIHYCHECGIAHRDLKPENLLVHNTGDGSCILKIADFGLSAAFGPSLNQRATGTAADHDTVIDSLGSPLSQNSLDDDPSFGVRDGNFSPASVTSVSSVKGSMDRVIASGVSALSFLTCGAMENVLCIPNGAGVGPSPLRRMTSVVGSPHYVAPEIISQTDENGEKRKGHGYDGSKADVWSAGVILYAMLFRSLPFGEDLLRCPRFQSYRKWYDEVRTTGGRRSSADAALNPNITEADQRLYLGPHWFFPSMTSKESRDLIVAMLNPRAEDRLSIAQVLGHPWLLAEQSSNMAL
ncbi:serine/threonine protein kinase-like protein [Nitzschia inconspicua]|uniref:non-specific serine/threonine protein kinase n=1 Tax=Nitzschia inconspicua TaxID=303405 RepID=A0A9K3KKW3_9STRA|nr:serine/threonine protein kinase-like protein [Nitzschia inconspicua]